MKLQTILSSAALAGLLASCAGTHPKGSARFDDYDAVKVEQMTGNNVSQAVFAKTILCLNARREARQAQATTNAVITSATNYVVTAVTNQTVSHSTNVLFTTMTNLSPAVAPVTIQAAGDATSGTATDTNVSTTPTLVSTGPSVTTNTTFSVAANFSGTRAPNQLTANQQVIRTLNNQLTTASNNLSVAVMTNMVISGETNWTVSYLTNTTVVSVTNTMVIPTNGVAFDYFLVTELIPPPDFTPLAQGETLVLLVDGVRYGFTPSQPGTAFVARKGYASVLYRVPPDVLVAIANAQEVRVRLKGVNNVVERSMNRGSRQNFRDFLARYFVPDPASDSPGETARVAQR